MIVFILFSSITSSVGGRPKKSYITRLLVTRLFSTKITQIKQFSYIDIFDFQRVEKYSLGNLFLNKKSE